VPAQECAPYRNNEIRSGPKSRNQTKNLIWTRVISSIFGKIELEATSVL
jgi:hypothetical protein